MADGEARHTGRPLAERIELRRDDRGDLHDIVLTNARLVHIERMGEFVWIGVDLDDAHVALHLTGDHIEVVENPLSITARRVEGDET